MLLAEESTVGLNFTGGAAATSTLITFLLGLGIVFIGLIALILIIKLMGWIMRKAQKQQPQPEQKTEAAPVERIPEGDRGEIIAAVSAAIATVLGESVSGIRIVSFKKVD
jgi:sodium pump decarboxylase gamma subunit